LPYPVRNARFTVQIGYLDATGTPTDPVTPDTEISQDGNPFADCVEEVTTITGGNGVGYITLTGQETNCFMLSLISKVASGPKASLIPDIRPRALPILWSVQATAGSSGSLTLPTTVPRVAGLLKGCILRTTGGTGGGGTGGLNNQARVVTDFSSAGVAGVAPNWEGTAPDSSTLVDVLLADGSMLRMADLALIGGDDGAAARALLAFNTEALVVVGSASNTITINTTSIAPTAATTDQFKGCILAFSRLTTTTNLRGQKTRITASTSAGVLTVDPLTTAPVSGDVAVIV
jgi:hypothetical protein